MSYQSTSSVEQSQASNPSLGQTLFHHILIKKKVYNLDRCFCKSQSSGNACSFICQNNPLNNWIAMTSNELSAELDSYQKLLGTDKSNAARSSSEKLAKFINSSPLVDWSVKQLLARTSSSPFLQYGVLCHESPATEYPIKPILLNTNVPWSAFLCGSQGSGKSHTLSCMLENCLLRHEAVGRNPNPLAGIVFHYDSSQTSGVCEAAYLSSKVKTRVLVSKSSYKKLRSQYLNMASKVNGNLTVEQLEIHPSHLDTARVKTLMAVGTDTDMPLYMHTILKILRDMAIESGGEDRFDYRVFKNKLTKQGFMEKQTPAVKMRLDLLESFLDVTANTKTRDLLKGESGVLTIIDLTDPVIDADTACVLFDICLSIFMSQTRRGTIVALDEAHNYMSESSSAAGQFTGRLLKTVREQRHQGARVVIATQEPTINTALLDLCSITMVHRCTSPAWFAVLKKHVAGLHMQQTDNESEQDGSDTPGANERGNEIFRQIVQLKLGESLLFCPMAAVGFDERGELQRMNHRFMKVKTRDRVTNDGGVSKLAGDGY
ncbi:unnamed protein product [Periconia digitata]|uniref:AAA+ ATPase domain-containing protein n=1 Tax=Periconia digitata TaxID=1303443 RepID=A0A9W4XUR6_9PLEO|nr:unnamed protein product [Periconia digitata]